MTRVLPLQAEFHVTDNHDAARSARDRVVTLADTWSVPLSEATTADVRVCASEVITNALVHGGGECTVRVLWNGAFLTVEVTDRSLRLRAPG